MLSCDCAWESEWWYIAPPDFSKFSASKRKRCVSCKNLIDIGSVCVRLECFRNALSDIEERISGCEVQLADKYLCESCGEIFFNLSALGYCMGLGDDMREELKEYWELTGFTPKVK